MSEETAVCRCCGMKLDGKPFYMGGRAFIPGTFKQARKNYYGGFVCSRECDYKACAELEDSMPGHGYGSSRKYGISHEAQARIESNWGE